MKSFVTLMSVAVATLSMSTAVFAQSVQITTTSAVTTQAEITTTMAPVISDELAYKIQLVADAIIVMIDDGKITYETVITLLSDYLEHFEATGDEKNAAIASMLLDEISITPPASKMSESCIARFDGCNTCRVTETGVAACTEMACMDYQQPYCIEYTTPEVEIPETCTVWYDGCNNCMVGDDGEMACTKMACVTPDQPMCKVYQKTITVADHTAECVGVGPMDCLLIQEQGADEWTYFYDSIEGFDYQEGTQYTLLVEETHLDPSQVPADASTISWSLVEVIDEE